MRVYTPPMTKTRMRTIQLLCPHRESPTWAVLKTIGLTELKPKETTD